VLCAINRIQWTIRQWKISEMALQPDTELLEFICEENEQDEHRMVGK